MDETAELMENKKSIAIILTGSLIQSRLTAFFHKTSFSQFLAHNSRHLSALLNSPIDQAGLKLDSVLIDQNLGVSRTEQVAVLATFRLPPVAGFLLVLPVIVTVDMRIAFNCVGP